MLLYAVTISRYSVPPPPCLQALLYVGSTVGFSPGSSVPTHLFAPLLWLDMLVYTVTISRYSVPPPPCLQALLYVGSTVGVSPGSSVPTHLFAPLLDVLTHCQAFNLWLDMLWCTLWQSPGIPYHLHHVYRPCCIIPYCRINCGGQPWIIGSSTPVCAFTRCLDTLSSL